MWLLNLLSRLQGCAYVDESGTAELAPNFGQVLRLTGNLEDHGRKKKTRWFVRGERESGSRRRSSSDSGAHAARPLCIQRSANEVSAGVRCCQTLVDTFLMFRYQGAIAAKGPLINAECA